MGCKYLFECKSCGYRAEVSGGDDLGMACATSTILCRDCGELYDVMVSEEPWSFDPVKDSSNARCPVSVEHGQELWRHPGPCPKCGKRIRKVAATELWD